MKDLDFDELDRAVTSALGNNTAAETDTVATTEPTAAADAAVTASEPQTTGSSPSISAHAVHSRIMPSVANGSRSTLQRKAVVPTDTIDTPASNPEATASDAAEPEAALAPVSQPAARRIPHRAGRFMDVVRPGQSVGTSAPAPKPPAVDDTPASADDDAVPAADATAKQTHDMPAAEPNIEINTSLEAAINELFVSEGHDPVAPSSPTDEPGPEAEPEAAATTPDPQPEEPSPDDTTSMGSDSVEAIAAELSATPVETAAPATSPFLSDAKVEKRPLGSLSDTVETETPELVDASSASVEQPTEVLEAPVPESENTPIPEELASDLLAIESGTPTPETKEAAPESAATPTGPASIARQYKERPRTASEDDESGAIFDPQTYQQPIEHPAKKSSGWGWVIAAVIIILLAVGAAVAAWFGGLLPVAL